MAYWRLNEAAGAVQFQPETGFGIVPLDAHDGTDSRGGAVNDTGPEAGASGVPFSDEADNKAVFLPNTGPYPTFPCRFRDDLRTNSGIDLSGTGDWTLEMWIRHADADATGYPWGASSTSEDLMGNEDLGTNKDGILIEIDGSGSPDFLPTKFRMRTRYDINGFNIGTDFRPDIPSPESIDWTAWHHIVFTTTTNVDGMGSIYFDGSLMAADFWNGSLTSTSEIFGFGQDRDWKGLLDEIALYNKGLTAEQVAAHYAAATLAEYFPGDANLDGVVDDEDASILGSNWLKSIGATWSHGDFNGDWAVDDKDAAILAAHWGQGPEASPNVPEPSTISLLAALGVLCLAGRIRRRV